MRNWKVVSENPRNGEDVENFELRARILQKTLVCLDDFMLDELSVATICREANVSRTTFYRLFSSKHDVYNWFFRVTLRSNIAQVGDVFSWDQALLHFFRSMDANRRLSQIFFSAQGPSAPRKKCVEYVKRALTRTTLLRFPGQERIPYRYEFEITAFARSFTFALIDWLEEDSPSYSMVDNVLAIVPHDLFEMLDVNVAGHPLSNESVRRADDSAVIELVAEEVFTSF